MIGITQQGTRGRDDTSAYSPAPRYVPQMMVLVYILISLHTAVVWPFETKVIQAQQKLSALGYHLGAADGMLGPRTRDALKAFQRDHNLQITGTLNPPTLEALGLMTPSNLSRMLPPRPVPPTPWRVVLTYLRYYNTQPARLLQVVTEHFRQGMTPQQWLQQTSAILAAQNFSRLSWDIERVEVDATSGKTRATVHVQSHVRIQGEEIARQEVFSLIRASESEWLIDAWQSTPLPKEPTASQTDS